MPPRLRSFWRIGLVLAILGLPAARSMACDDNNEDQSDQPYDPPPDPGDDGVWASNGDGSFDWLPEVGNDGTSTPDPTPPSPPLPPPLPAISWTALPGGNLAPGTSFAVSAVGTDSAGLLSGVMVDWSQDGGASWSPFAYAGGNDGYSGASGNPVSAAASALYQFRTWAVDSSGQSSGVLYSGVYPVSSPPPTYPVTISASGPGGVSTSGGTYVSGTTLSVSAIPNPSSRFDSWSGDYGGTANPATLTVTGPMSVTASFTDLQATLSLLTSGAGTATGAGTYAIGTTVTIAATPGAQARFVGWTPTGGVENASAPLTRVSLSQDLTLTATFTAATATLTTAVVGNGQILGGGTYPLGGTATVTAMPQGSSVFAGWSGDLSGSVTPATLVMDADKSVTAQFAALLPQTIVPTIPPAQSPTAPPVTLQAVASSGLPVSFQLTSGPGTLNGAVVTLNGQTGTISLLALQGGNGVYAAAPSVPFSFAVIAGGKRTTLSTTESASKKNDPKTPNPSYLLGPTHP